MALAEKATAKRDVGKVVARSMELVTGLENGATRKLDVDGKMSTWGASNSSSTHAQRWRRGELGVEEWRPLRSLENQFAALMNDDKEGHNDTEAAASETVVPQEDNKRKSTVSRWKPQSRKEEEGGKLWIAVDSGTSENVISEKMAPQIKCKEDEEGEAQRNAL